MEGHCASISRVVVRNLARLENANTQLLIYNICYHSNEAKIVARYLLQLPTSISRTITSIENTANHN